MKKPILLLVLTLFLSINCYSQVVFENGYFIDPTNKKTDCLIENLDWKNTPLNFRYKLSGSEDIITADLKAIKEFAITGESKYIRVPVKVDRSSKFIEEMSTEKNPIFKEETLLLKVLIEGKASLYIYDEGSLTRFFYKINDGEIKQLVYKSYLVNENSSVAKNNYFREQLFIDLKCDNILQREYENLNYDRRSLLKLFVKYNKCSDTNFTEFEKKEKKDLFNLTVRPRLNSSLLSMSSSNVDFYNVKFDSKSNIGVGLEAEFIFPFNRNKWALIVEPTYQYYKNEKTKETTSLLGGQVTAKVDYKSIELPIGLRHYFFLKNDSKIFINASYLADFALNSKIELFRKDGSSINTLDIKSRSTLALGVGGKLHDKYSIELRYIIDRSIVKDYIFVNSSFSTASLILGYSFF
ncbi:autotransporter outer membrane beta-barrel domain-containing protein [Flavobacterium sp. CSZ]|uniref:autotransporter outer membrane beta-barrel domain-containing protein n=1 Tax=Flavobacterium sp. CSZ TaxID=2783791 RepID=UPI00188A9B53|nr:autotransporter outer membrane beta-barrel domain-containing protein [Flavobacterium sp. CSZ]MBF4485130.1 outer membrane beta-barrel protein [Flavobacterium sp. CSZ]